MNLNSRQLLIVVPLAALLGIGAALSLYYLADRSHSKLPAFQLQLAKQSAGRAAVDHSPSTSAAERKAKELREARRARAARRAREARVASANARAQAAAALAAERSGNGSANTVDALGAPAQSQPAPTPVSSPAPRSTPRSTPRRSPAPRPSGGGGGGGSFDDSG
jgi:hypothetical protein